MRQVQKQSGVAGINCGGAFFDLSNQFFVVRSKGGARILYVRGGRKFGCKGITLFCYNVMSNGKVITRVIVLLTENSKIVPYTGSAFGPYEVGTHSKWLSCDFMSKKMPQI